MFVHCQHSNPAKSKAECGYCGRSACVFERGLVNESQVLQPEEIQPDWHKSAACRSLEPAVFFDLNSRNNRVTAIQTCSNCPVQTVCLLENLDTEYGIFGGRTPVERREYATRNGVTRDCVECGSTFLAFGLTRVCSSECKRLRRHAANRKWYLGPIA
jgi:hypothetical protein